MLLGWCKLPSLFKIYMMIKNNWKEQFLALKLKEQFEADIKNVDSFYSIRNRLSRTNPELKFEVKQDRENRKVIVRRVLNWTF